MHIAFDARAFSWTGIGRYITSLLKELSNIETPHRFSVLVPSDKLASFNKQIELPTEKFTIVPVEPSYYSWREQTIFLYQLWRLNPDLVHFTHFNIPWLWRGPYVVTIHDTTRFIFPGQKRQSLWQQLAYEWLFARAVSRARQVICVTRHTRAELQQLPLPLGHEPKVIYEGVDKIFSAPILPIDKQRARMFIGSTDPYLLYVGVWMSHKNIYRILQAYAGLVKSHPDLKLVVTGKPVPGYSNVRRQVEQLSLEGKVFFCGYVPEKLLPALYSEASCFIFPSLYEGFGLPPLEAAAVGTPVVTSNVSSLPEVMGAAAEYVNPESVASIITGIKHVLDDQGAPRLVEKGKLRARQFTWKKCAAETLAAYEK